MFSVSRAPDFYHGELAKFQILSRMGRLEPGEALQAREGDLDLNFEALGFPTLGDALKRLIQKGLIPPRKTGP